MTHTTHSRMKWWLLRYGIFIPFVVISLLFLFLLLSLYVFSHFNPPFFLAFVVPLVVVLLSFQGFSYDNLWNAVKKLPSAWIREDFDPIRCTVTVREGTREYKILYHSSMVAYSHWVHLKNRKLLMGGAPEHYQIWTTYRGNTSILKDRYSLLSLVQTTGVKRLLFPALGSSTQKETVFDEHLMRIVPHLHEEAKEISSLRFVELAAEDEETIIVVLLTGNGKEHIHQALNLLKEVVHDAEVLPSTGLWGWEE